MRRNIKISDAIDSSTEIISKRVIAVQSQIEGKEELISGGLQSELTNHLIDCVKRALPGISLPNVSFRVESFTKKQEKQVGADLGFVIKIKKNGKEISKAFLAQSKIGKYRKRKKSYYAYNADILTQANNMLNLTSDSFFLLYTEKGVKCFSALQIKLNNKNSINSVELPYHSFGWLIKEFFGCFVGDNHIGGIYQDPTMLLRVVQENAVNVVEITAEIKSNDSDEEDE
jgi:hypothetical protein